MHWMGTRRTETDTSTIYGRGTRRVLLTYWLKVAGGAALGITAIRHFDLITSAQETPEQRIENARNLVAPNVSQPAPISVELDRRFTLTESMFDDENLFAPVEQLTPEEVERRSALMEAPVFAGPSAPPAAPAAGPLVMAMPATGSGQTLRPSQGVLSSLFGLAAVGTAAWAMITRSRTGCENSQLGPPSD